MNVVLTAFKHVELTCQSEYGNVASGTNHSDFWLSYSCESALMFDLKDFSRSFVVTQASTS